MSISHQELKNLLAYNPDTGCFVWKISPAGPVSSGSLAGSKKPEYICICIHKKMYKAHRLAWFYTHEKWPEKDIDHINGDGQDNRICNLRLATMSQNMANSKKRKTNKSGYKGTWLHKASGLYAAQVTVNYVPYHLGYFKTPKEAHEAYCKAAKKHFGEFARAA